MSPLDYFCTVREKNDFFRWKYGAEPAEVQVRSTGILIVQISYFSYFFYKGLVLAIICYKLW